ncbi:MAG: NAD(P)-dependent oxidoreductase [Pirellulales bacterium]
MDKQSIHVGWIGTGVMGSSMCGHLIRAGYRVTAYNRSSEKLFKVKELGASAADDVAQLASTCDIVFSIVGFPSDVRQVYLGPNGLVNHARPGSILVDMTTSQPSLAVEIAKAASARGLHALDAPVSGGDIGAREARLSIMVGGDESTFQKVLPLFECMGKTILLQGASGAGQHTKMVNQTLIAANMVGVCEALLYAYKSGLNIERVLESVTPGAAGSWSLSNLAPRMVRGDFAPGFFVDHFVKDMGIVLDEASRMRLALPGLGLAHQLYVALQAQGGGLDGTQALIRALASLSNLDWPPPEHPR